MEKLLIYVTVGTCHFKFNRMLDQVKQLLEVLPYDYEVVLQYGETDLINLPGCVKSVCYLSREASEELYQSADVVFSHTGIGSIFNSLKFNRPTVLFARLEEYSEFSDNHQLQIATEIRNNDLIYLVDSEALNTDSFLAFIDEKISTLKQEVDLTNYELASFINSRFYC